VCARTHACRIHDTPHAARHPARAPCCAARAAQVNPNGGAIALGHPLGCTGARMTATLLHEMARRGAGARFGVVSMCVGSGMGAAALFERGSEADQLRNAKPVTGRQVLLSRDAVA
jgi:hypothetical protein